MRVDYPKVTSEDINEFKESILKKKDELYIPVRNVSRYIFIEAIIKTIVSFCVARMLSMFIWKFTGNDVIAAISVIVLTITFVILSRRIPTAFDIKVVKFYRTLMYVDTHLDELAVFIKNIEGLRKGDQESIELSPIDTTHILLHNNIVAVPLINKEFYLNTNTVNLKNFDEMFEDLVNVYNRIE